ncbi:MAG: hypothetical protein HN833_00760 [Elusimicrobiaceae bacterium]|jgi:hypothetical protein|nr:hypothetical protein [Elusimicrobiaceae bacterium]MBT3955143.1 hypothetical protein [Elusimicrobiaceae bacterium]MBT4007964.1 hypothetical protein [Elusimicrobiaceae bacterium]MBT4402655.1 hypothetical protein [Elusimicrobiaceae bacterium]MBT4440328.1 hypothetical protein [Elusimicrobiaceae bacterium]
MKKLVIFDLDDKHKKTKNFKVFLEVLSKNENIILTNLENNNLQKTISDTEDKHKVEIPTENIYVIFQNLKQLAICKQLNVHTALIRNAKENKQIHYNAELIIEDFKDLETWLIWLGLEKDPKGIKVSTYMLPETAIDHIHVARTGTNLQEEKQNGK